jgi:hypothetical protein
MNTEAHWYSCYKCLLEDVGDNRGRYLYHYDRAVDPARILRRPLHFLERFWLHFWMRFIYSKQERVWCWIAKNMDDTSWDDDGNCGWKKIYLDAERIKNAR